MQQTNVSGFLCGIVLLTGSIAGAQSPPVRIREAYSRGFLTVRTEAGKVIASGELSQVPHGDRITSRLIFRFRDGSIDDETTIYSQGQGGFRLISDHHIQKGPSFPKPYDATIDMAAQQVGVKDEKNPEGKAEKMDLPPELCNGLLLTLMRNLRANGGEVEIPYLAVASRSRVVRLDIEPQGLERFRVDGSSFKADKFIIRIKLGGVVGVLAPLVGKQPDDAYVWVATGEVPMVVRADTQFYAGGPVWSVRLGSAEW